jgi:2-methylisocitrate lyase-like PEP mutase family enzyme
MVQTEFNLLQQRDKARRFRELHHSGKLVLFPNIWDPLGAALLEELNFPAIATASASVAFSNGYDDGQNIPFTALLTLLKRIVSSVSIPVSADIESGFAETDTELKQNIRLLLEAGIVGINVEDTDKKTNSLLSVELASERIKLIRNTSEEVGVPLFINARSDVYLRGKEFDTPETKLAESLRRGLAYKAAGADCFYPITMSRKEEIQRTVDELRMPVNVLIIEGIPELKELNDIGVARVSLGPGLLKIAIQSMKKLAIKLQKLEGMDEIIKNEVTSPYLKHLVNRV